MAAWWRHQMETFFTLLALCAGNSPVTGEFPAQRPVTWSFDVFFDLHLNNQLNKKSWGRWFEMLSSSLWHHYNGNTEPVYSLFPKTWLFLISYKQTWKQGIAPVTTEFAKTNKTKKAKKKYMHKWPQLEGNTITKYSAVPISHRQFPPNHINLSRCEQLKYLSWTQKSQAILTHWGWDKMAAISQMTFSSAFPWMKTFELQIKFHWNMFHRV